MYIPKTRVENGCITWPDGVCYEIRSVTLFEKIEREKRNARYASAYGKVYYYQCRGCNSVTWSPKSAPVMCPTCLSPNMHIVVDTEVLINRNSLKGA